MKKVLKILLSIVLSIVLLLMLLVTRGYFHYKSNNFNETMVYSIEISINDRNINTWIEEICLSVKSIKSYNWSENIDSNLIKRNDLEPYVRNHLEYDLKVSKKLKDLTIKHLLQLIGIY